jgi:hypothetical protein
MNLAAEIISRDRAKTGSGGGFHGLFLSIQGDSI